ncbi:hypothetical protein H6F50_03795, partial [Coleofasciculus sp. FACHB-712]|nr:hypothetical protein [Coleofasciculus sp. FACHB-712]
MSATSRSQVQSSTDSQHQNQFDETAPVAKQGVTNKNPARTIPPLLGANLAELTQWVLAQGQPA